jgi:hypothetical protein
MNDLKAHIGQLQEEMKTKLSSVSPFNDELPVIGNTVSYLRSTLHQLHKYIAEYQFISVTEEIDFFKNTKPILVSQYLFHHKIFSIRSLSSFQRASQQRERIIKAMETEQMFVKKNYPFYIYCMSNATHLDEQYFLRNLSAHESITVNPRFSTSHDGKLSRFIAGELMKPVLVNQLNYLDNQSDHATSSLTWTASKTDLTELIYALQATGVFNDGTADLRQVAGTFQAMFGIDLKDYYRLYQDIRVRKTSQKSFIIRLKEHLQAKLDEKL